MKEKLLKCRSSTGKSTIHPAAVAVLLHRFTGGYAGEAEKTAVTEQCESVFFAFFRFIALLFHAFDTVEKEIYGGMNGSESTIKNGFKDFMRRAEHFGGCMHLIIDNDNLRHLR
jgi:hypothetical protein